MDGTISEDGGQAAERFCSVKDGINWSNSNSFEVPMKLWTSLITEYGQRSLSRPTDKLPAMGELAKLFQGRLGNPEYVAGLWSTALIQGLAWQGLLVKANELFYRFTGPSWSWASYEGTAAYGSSKTRDWEDIAKVRAWFTDAKEATNPFGEVKSAWIQLDSSAQ